MRAHLRAVALAALLVSAACATSPGANARRTGRRSSAYSIGCIDTLHASDTISTIVKMSVASQDSASPLPADFEGFFVEEFRSHFRVPAKLPLSVVRGSEPCDSLGSRCVGGVLSVGAIAYATAHNNGKLSDIAVVDVSLTPHFADSVTSALEAMSRAEMVPATGEFESIPVILKINSEEHPDSVPEVRHLFKAKIPRYDRPFSYASMPAAGVDAKYPFPARLAGLEDSVTLGFTVQSDGSIVPASIALLSATYRDFVSSVVEALGKTQYHPAHLGDCAVATRVNQRFLFKLPE